MRINKGHYLAVLLLCAIPVWGGNSRPNILFIIVDDQSPFDLKVYDAQSTLETPVIDRLAAEGMVFDAAHHMGAWAGGVCTPSRHMIMSGRTVWHIPDKPKMRRNPLSTNPRYVPTDLADHTMAAVFNAAGYDTMRTCKRGNSYAAANQQFTVIHDATKRGGTDETGSAWHAEQVLDFLKQRESSQDRDPFLIYFGFSHPHDVRDGKPELLTKYGAVNHRDKDSLPPAHPKQPRLPVNYLPAHPFDNTHMNVRDQINVSGVWKNRDERTIRNELGRECACSENIDIQIGRVLEQLKAMGELDNTYIFYTADHGMAIGRHGLQGKQNLYEHTWRVPFIVKGPGIQGGTRVPGNIYLLDVLATLCDLAGFEAPETCEGLSIKPILEGRQDLLRDTLYGVYCGGEKPGMRSVKQGDWKLIKYESTKDGVSETQLFNLAENPDELLSQHHLSQVSALTGNYPRPNQINLAGDTRYVDRLKEMEQLLLSEMRKHDDPYRFSNQPKGASSEVPYDGSMESVRKMPTRQPNVILVMTDDQGYGDLGCHGNLVLKTPNLDRLHAEAVRFTDFHVSPFCTPTRAALMTGNYPGKTGAYRTSSGRTMMHTDEKTVAHLFADHGYATGMVGKWHLGDNAPHRPQDRGFQDVVWHRCGGIGQASDYWGNDYFDDVYERNGQFERFEGYCTDVWFREGIRFVEENKDRSFFLYLALNAPHGPYRRYNRKLWMACMKRAAYPLS